MVDRVICPVLVRRDEELAVLEDALLSAHRGDSRFVAVTGDAGIGKTRLTMELAASARKLGSAVLWGACSEAELSLPYLPFVEAIGNHLASEDVGALGARLGPAARELAQLFPQLSDGAPPEPGQDPAQARLRLFEAVVALLSAISSGQTLLLVVDDIHWADASTRELLDHLTRRLAAMRALLVVTYRGDELHRRHPLTPVVQSWRRAGIAETVRLEPLPPAGVAEIIGAVFDTPEIGDDFRNLMHDRSEGNPFVLEEMLKEAIERGDIFRTARGWERKSLGELHIPDTVRDTILLRLERQDPETVTVLQAGAVLGRVFDYETLAAVSDAGDETVYAALEAATGQQLIEEQPGATSAWRWRHALTQEAIYGDMVTPRRQQLHGRAADALAAMPASRSIDRANHLLGAARFAEAVPVCLESAVEAERALAFDEAMALLERALPHVADPLERARVVCATGRLAWFAGQPAAAAQFLSDGIEMLEALGEAVEAARFRVILGRCHWELQRSDLAMRDFEAARHELEASGPSADLAMAYLRISGIHAFQGDYDLGVQAARCAIEVGEAAGADFERVWAHAFLSINMAGKDLDAGLEIGDAAYAEAVGKDYWLIAGNVAYNDVWIRIHYMQPEVASRVARLEGLASVPAATASLGLTEGYGGLATGELESALEALRSAGASFTAVRNEKMAWRANVGLAEVLMEMARLEEAAAVLPSVSERTDLQDTIYDAAAQIRVRLERNEIADAAALAEEIHSQASYFARLRGVVEVAVEALVAAGRIEEARTLIGSGRAFPVPAALSLLDEAEARVLIAEGDPGAAVPLARSAAAAALELGYPLAAWRASVLLAEALCLSGEVEEAGAVLRQTVPAAEVAAALRIAGHARRVAADHGIDLPAPPERAETAEPGESQPLGERLVTSLFADVRGYSELTAAMSPQELSERMTALYRFARTEVARHYGIVDKFAGDAVMATFNASGNRIDHCVQALEAALALRDKAALLDLRLGIGIAVGPAVLEQGVSDANIAVRGVTTNLAARLQAAAGGGEILLSDEAHRRVEDWLTGHDIRATGDEVELKGFEGAQTVYRLAAPPGLTA